MDRILCIAGPTASGKTELAVAVALALNGEVVSCDSMQVYRRMDIGTAKPTLEERRGVPHHMLDVAEPSEPMSVGKFVDLAAPVVEDILARGKTAILAGGTGLYMDALIRGNGFAPDPDPRYAGCSRTGPGRRGRNRFWKSSGPWTRRRRPGCTPPMRSGSSGPWRCTDRRGRL